MAYQTTNPFTGKVLESYPSMTDAQLEAAVARSHTRFGAWRHESFAERAAICRKAAAILRAQIEEFARLVTLEMGKLIEESRGEVALSADIIDYYAEHAERFLAPEMLQPASGEAVIESAPIGIVFGVQPWNFPYYQLARLAAPNIMAGNVVMVKHAEIVPQCANAFEKLWAEAGAPV
jgi:succinate-semialdehyde dehydrogenase/glutarate-semialdehyde dehydrogenase